MSSVVLTDTVVVMAQLETWEAMAHEASDSVDTGSVVANVGVTCALVSISAGVPSPCQLVAIVAHTLETALNVVAVSVLTNAYMLHAFVYV